ncbi:MAG: tetratricopeptide repeat protein, partial [Spirochaetaceae bacterium]|nr:tetratricopeptide repeat protein [Spirochaetaceae bacterium]
MKLRLNITLITVGLIVIVFLSGCVTGAGEHDTDGHDVDGGEAGIGMMPPPPSPSRAIVEALDAWDDVDRAIGLYSHAVEINPELALAYFMRAGLLRQVGAREMALDDYTRAIEMEPGFLQAYVERGFFRMWELGDESGAEDIETAYSIDPHDVPTALAFVDLLEWREPEHALDILNRLTDEHPGHPGPFLRRAKMRRNQGEYAAAAEDFAQAIRRGLDEPWIRTERAMVLVAAGDVAGALRETETAFEQDPNSPDVALMRARLTILIGGPDNAGRFYQVYLESEWVHQPVKLEAAFVAAARGEEDLVGNLIRSFEETENDPL